MSGRYSRRARRSTWASRRTYYRRSRFGSNAARRARGNMRAASQQNDTSDVVINLMTTVKTGVTGYTNISGEFSVGVAALNVYDLLRKSEFFDSYKNMYDQFRITRVQVKLTPVTWKTYDQFNIPTHQGSATSTAGNVNLPIAEVLEPEDGLTVDYVDNQGNAEKVGIIPEYLYPQAMTVITAWDRTGLDDSQFKSYIIGEGQNAVVKYHTTIGNNITTYSSSKSTQLVGGATFNCTRYLYPSSQQEKSMYFSTNDLKEQFYSGNGDNNYYLYSLPTGVECDKNIITNLYASPNCPFKPTLLIGLLEVEKLAYGDNFANTKNKIHPVTFNCEFDIGVTFRGLRKAQVV